jgi:hypothetical protein
MILKWEEDFDIGYFEILRILSIFLGNKYVVTKLRAVLKYR